MSDTLIHADKVGKKFCRDLKKSLWYGVKDSIADVLSVNPGSERLRADEFWANQDISFHVNRGECLGLIGRNGAGKTTLLKMLNGLIKPDVGSLTIRGKVGALIALGAGFNPILTGRENIEVNASILGLSRRQTRSVLDDVVAFSELEDFIDTPVRSYSSGMQVRLGFAVASHMSPDVFLIDEVLAVGDFQFKAKAKSAIETTIANGTAVVFVSHNMHEVAGITNDCIWLDKGKVRDRGATEDILSKYLDEKPTGTENSFEYSPNRSGLAELKQVLVEGGEQDSRVLELKESGPTQQFSLRLSLKMDVDSVAWHGFNIRTIENTFVARAVLSDVVNATAGEEIVRRFELKVPDLLPGTYFVEYFVWIAGGVMLEGMRNLLRIEITPEVSAPFLRRQNKNFVLSKMSDNSKGAIPLRLSLLDP